MAVVGEINLANLGAGAAAEKWQEELRKVLANIMDPATEAQAKRTIVLKVTIKPNKDRIRGKIEVATEARLAAAMAYETQGYFGMDRQTGELVACEDNPHQLTIDNFLDDARQTVEPLEEHRKENGGGQC